MATTLLAGVARADITPPIGIAHANWGAQLHERAAGIDQPLCVTVLALSDGETTSLIVDVDTCWFWDNLANDALVAIRDLTGLPEEAIRISYSHTHSAPAGGASQSWVSGGTEMMEGYHANLRQCAAGAAWSAMKAMQPVRVASATGASSISVNRRWARPGDGAVVVGRNWGGPLDPEVNVLRFDTLEGDPHSAIVHFGCHPITVGPDNDQITPDYPGVVRQIVGEATGATCLFLQGAAGDIGPIRGVARNGVVEYKKLGAALGHEAAKLWWEADVIPTEEHYVETLESGAPLAVYDDIPLPDQPAKIRVTKVTVDLPVKEPADPQVLEEQLRQKREELEQLRASGGDPDEIRRVTMSAKRASMRAKMNRNIQGNSSLPVEIYATAIGDEIALVAMNVEMFAETGMAIKKNSPFRKTIVSGYAGPSGGYLPTEDAYPLGGYEVEVSPYAPGAAEIAADAVVKVLQGLRNGN